MANFSNDVWMASTASGFYPHSINQSLRFEDGDTARLTIDMDAGNRRTWTWSAWVKRGNLGSEQGMFGQNTTSEYVRFESNDTIRMRLYSGSTQGDFKTTQVFRDVSSWYHIVVAVDTTQATSTNRVKFYVNGAQITSFSTATYPAQNYQTLINSGSVMVVGGTTATAGSFDGYQAEVNFIDGLQLGPDSFGETKDGSIWVAKNTSGLTYGTNGFHLDFSDSSAIGNDVSGQNNDFAVSGLAATDVLPTSPTNTFAVLQPTAFVNIGGANSAQTLSEGNLKFTGTSNEGRSTPATIRVTSGKYYVEATKVSGSGSVILDFVVNDASVASKSTSTTGDIIIGAVDVDAGKYWSGLNNTWDGSGNPATGANPTGTFTANSSFTFSGRVYNSSRAGVLNFGQDSSFAGNKTSGSAGASDTNGIGDFYYTPPTDYLTLCSANLPEPEIIDGSEYFNTVLYTGDGSNGLAITGVNFQPNWTWIKSRSGTAFHELHDSVRGAGKRLFSNETTAEGDVGTVSSFDSDGFTVSRNSAYDGTNQNGISFVSWNWKAGTAFSNDASATGVGTIDSAGEINTEAGFSVIGYTGNGTDGASVAHGLSQTIEALIVKRRDASSHWQYLDKNLSAGKVLLFSSTDAETAYSTFSGGGLDNLASATFSLEDGSSNGVNVNASGSGYIAYCFHSVEGYSKIGSYTGLNSSDNAYVHLGFRPAWVMCKSYTQGGSGYDWVIYDNKRSPANPVGFNLEANNAIDDESVRGVPIDFLSNGFKIRNSYAEVGSNKGYIYLAFAEQPFKYSNAR